MPTRKETVTARVARLLKEKGVDSTVIAPGRLRITRRQVAKAKKVIRDWQVAKVKKG